MRAAFSAGNPGARIPMTNGAKRIPSSVIALMKTRVRVATLLASPPGRLIAFRRDAPRERRDERGRERALGKKIAQHVGRAEGGQERVHVARRAEERSDHHFADQPEHPAAKHGETDDARRFGAHSFPFRSPTWARKNSGRDL